LKLVNELLDAGYDKEKLEKKFHHGCRSLKQWVRNIKFPTNFDIIMDVVEYMEWKKKTKPKLVSHLRRLSSLAPYQLDLIKNHARGYGLILPNENLEQFLGLPEAPTESYENNE
jgi:hypothetical protein